MVDRAADVATSPGLQSSGRPNVLLIFVDSLRGDQCFGPGRGSRTPTIDALAARSTVFTKAFATASTTTISAASTLSGTYPFVHGVRALHGRRVPSEIALLSEAFRSNGYYTWAEMTGPLVEATGLNRGFDRYQYRHYTQWLDTEFGDALRTRIQDDTPGPWFGFLHLWEIHYPRRVTPNFRNAASGSNLYEQAVSSLDAQLKLLLDALPPDTVIIFTADHGEHISESRSGQLLASMKGVAAWLRRNVPGVRWRKRVMNAIVKVLDRVRRRDSDFYGAWHGHGFHVYDPLLHVPLFLHGPGRFTEGVQVSQVVSHVDLFPTLVKALALEGADGRMVSGLDLVPSIGAPQAQLDGRPIYMEACGAMLTNHPDQWLRGIRTDRYKYVRGLTNDAVPVELYDLEADPSEKRNLAPEEPELAAAMEAKMANLVASGSSAQVGTETYTAEEMEEVEGRLRDLGYLD